MRFYIYLPDDEVVSLVSPFHTVSAFSVLSHYLHSAEVLVKTVLSFLISSWGLGCRAFCALPHAARLLRGSCSGWTSTAGCVKHGVRPPSPFAADLLLLTAQRHNPHAWIQTARESKENSLSVTLTGNRKGFNHGTQPLPPVLMDNPFCVLYNRIQSSTQCKQISR